MSRKKQAVLMISGGLTVLAVVFSLLARRLSCTLAALAMGCSFLGDAVLAGAPGCFEIVKNKLVKGGLAFFAAHILYITALAAVSGRGTVTLMPGIALPFAVFFALTAFHGGLFYFCSHSSVPRAFFAAAFGYLLTAGAHAAMAIAVYGQIGGYLVLNAAGALLFYFSDAVLLARKYGAVRGKHLSLLIWLTYVPAQLCLLLGFYLA